MEPITFALHGVADRDPDEFVFMLFPTPEARDEFKVELPGRYAEVVLIGVDFNVVSIATDIN